MAIGTKCAAGVAFGWGLSLPLPPHSSKKCVALTGRPQGGSKSTLRLDKVSFSKIFDDDRFQALRDGFLRRLGPDSGFATDARVGPQRCFLRTLRVWMSCANFWHVHVFSLFHPIQQEGAAARALSEGRKMICKLLHRFQTCNLCYML